MGLFLLVLAAMLAAVDRATTQHARAQIKESLNIDSRVFTRLFDARSERLIEGVRILLGDFALRGAIATRDRDTIFSALENHGARIGANIALLVSLDNILLVNTLRPQAASEPFPFPRLTEVAALRGEATSIVFFGSHAFQLVVVPVNAPEPIAWVCMGFRVDARLAQELHKLTSAHVSFLRADTDGQWLEIATTLPSSLRESLKQGLPSETIGQDQPLVLDMGGEQYETRTLPLAAELDTPVVAVLQQSLDEALAPFYHLAPCADRAHRCGVAGGAHGQRRARTARDPAGGGIGRGRARNRQGKIRPPGHDQAAGRALANSPRRSTICRAASPNARTVSATWLITTR